MLAPFFYSSYSEQGKAPGSAVLKIDRNGASFRWDLDLMPFPVMAKDRMSGKVLLVLSGSSLKGSVTRCPGGRDEDGGGHHSQCHPEAARGFTGSGAGDV